jgi:quercetin dioxygenase-like cupin family protein
VCAARSLLLSKLYGRRSVKPVLELLPDYVLGALPADEQRHVHALVDGSPELQREVDRVSEALAMTAEQVAPVVPPASLRARLMHTLGGVDRFAPFFDDLTRLFELPVETIRKLLARVDGFDWETTLLGVQLHGSELFHFPVGPRLRETGAAGGVLRVRAGVTFPQHRHHGDEVTYVLEGGYVAGGHIYGPGSTIPMSAGTEHDYQSAPQRDLVIMVLHHGITLLGA